MKNFYEIYKEAISKVSPIKDIGGKNTLLVTVNKRATYKPNIYHFKMKSDKSKEDTISLTTPKSKNGYNNFQEVYDDFKLRISKHFLNGVKNPSKFYSEVYRYMAISILSAQLGLSISYQDRDKYKQFVDSFISDYWINYQPSTTDNWTNLYPDQFKDPNGNVKTPGNRDMSVYIQIGDEEWEKIRISDHAIMSNTTATVLEIISKDTFEKLLFKNDGNILDFINEVKKEYNDFIKNEINDKNSIRKIANIVVQYEQRIRKFIADDKFLSKQDITDIKDIINRIISSNGNTANVIKNLSDDERKKLIGIVNHQILTDNIEGYMKKNKIHPTQKINVSIDDVNDGKTMDRLFDIKKIISKYV